MMDEGAVLSFDAHCDVGVVGFKAETHNFTPSLTFLEALMSVTRQR